MRYRFIERERIHYPVTLLCQALAPFLEVATMLGDNAVKVHARLKTNAVWSVSA